VCVRVYVDVDVEISSLRLHSLVVYRVHLLSSTVGCRSMLCCAAEVFGGFSNWVSPYPIHWFSSRSCGYHLRSLYRSLYVRPPLAIRVRFCLRVGAIIALGGDRPKLQPPFDKGYFVNPTIVTDVPATCRALTEEIFGPVVTVTKFREEEEVIAYANSVKYGLSATVWTENVKRAHRVAHQLRVGVSESFVDVFE
jgi:Aldehyde dehydrogenase family